MLLQVGQLEAEPSLGEMPSRLRPNANDSKSDVTSQPKNFSVSGLPVQVGGASRPLGPTHPQAILMKQLQNKLTVKRSETTRSSEHLLSSEKVSPSSSQVAEVGKKGSSRRKSQPTRHDRKVLADIFPSSSFLSSCKGSPLTSSWESFTRPVKLTERHREEEEEKEVKDEANALLVGKREEQWSKDDGNSDTCTAQRSEQSKVHVNLVLEIVIKV